MPPTMRYKDRDSFKKKTMAKTNANRRTVRLCSSEEDDTDSDYYKILNVPSTNLRKDYYETRSKKQVGKRPERKRLCDLQDIDTSSCSSKDEDSDYTSPIVSKRKYVGSNNISDRKKKYNTSPMFCLVQDSDSSHIHNGNNSQAIPQEPSISDVQNTKENHFCGFHSCLIQALENIKRTFSMYESRLCHLQKNYFLNESASQDDMDNVMFIFSCVMSKLKDDLDKEENNLKSSYHSSQKQREEDSTAIKKQVNQKLNELESNEIIEISDEGHDKMFLELHEKSTMAEINTNRKQFKIQKVTNMHPEFSDNSISKICSKEKERNADTDSTTNDFINDIPALSRLTEITIETASKASNRSLGNDRYSKPSAILNSSRQESENMIPKSQSLDYDSDISTCSTVICRKPPKTDSTNGSYKNLVSQKYFTSKSEMFTKFDTTSKKNKRRMIISDLDHDSTGSEDASYHLQFSPGKTDMPSGFPSKSRTTDKKRTHSLRAIHCSQVFRQTSPVLVDINLINDPDHMYSEDEEEVEVDDKETKCYMPQKRNKNIVWNDRKLRMKCIVVLEHIRLQS